MILTAKLKLGRFINLNKITIVEFDFVTVKKTRAKGAYYTYAALVCFQLYTKRTNELYSEILTSSTNGFNKQNETKTFCFVPVQPDVIETYE
jgi:hypothetical protein